MFWLAASKEVDALVLFGHGVAYVERSDELDAVIVVLHICGVVTGDVDDDFAVTAMETPYPIIVVVTDRRRKAWFGVVAEEIDGACVAVVAPAMQTCAWSAGERDR